MPSSSFHDAKYMTSMYLIVLFSANRNTHIRINRYAIFKLSISHIMNLIGHIKGPFNANDLQSAY